MRNSLYSLKLLLYAHLAPISMNESLYLVTRRYEQPCYIDDNECESEEVIFLTLK